MTPPKLDEKVTEALTDDELRRVINSCKGRSFRDRRDEALIRLMAETGSRAGEVVALSVNDVDINKNDNGVATIIRGKGGRGRIVPFGPQTALAMGRYLRLRRTHRLADSPNLWLDGDGHSFSRWRRTRKYIALVRC
jgi:integrase/recombinase XerD